MKGAKTENHVQIQQHFSRAQSDQYGQTRYKIRGDDQPYGRNQKNL